MKEVQQLDPYHSADVVQPPDTVFSNQIDQMCDGFEAAWLRGESPQIEAFLERCDQSERALLLTELVLVDRELRIRQDEPVDRLDYHRRFPQYSEVIDKLEFSTIDDRRRRRKNAPEQLVLTVTGTKLAHFELLNELGSGASGTVWKAKDSRLKRTVAIKIPRQTALTDSERERFLREGQACAQLHHPNIIAVFEVGEDRGHAFIVAEYIEGLNLRDWLEKHRADPREAAELTAQLAEALHYAHEQGVIHRDLKPANVLIDNEGLAHIADFGLAKLTTSSIGMTVEGHILGTPAYMSPEQARGDSIAVDRRADVYGLGALLYELLTRQPAFKGDVTAIVHQVIHDDPESPRRIDPSISRDLETICLKAMQKVPSRRYPSAQELAVDLRRYLRAEPILARRTDIVQQCWCWCKRHPLAVVSMILCLLLVGISAIAASLAHDNELLQGFRRVRIASEPIGADIAFVRLNERTGDPIANEMIRAVSTSIFRRTKHLEANLKAGDYLVIAAFPDGRFTEVHRHVPSLSEAIPVVWRYSRWELCSDGTVMLSKVRVPEVFDTAGMVEIPLSSQDRQSDSALPKSIWIDAVEHGLGIRSNEIPLTWLDDVGNGDAPFYHDAMEVLECEGKRLPSVSEYEAVIHNLERIKPSDHNPTLRNLRDGLWEWTTTRIDLPGGEKRAVVGGSALNWHEQREAAYAVPIERRMPAVGFRGYRSVSPRFLNGTQ